MGKGKEKGKGEKLRGGGEEGSMFFLVLQYK